jgi:hypothetical protein
VMLRIAELTCMLTPSLLAFSRSWLQAQQQ